MQIDDHSKGIMHPILRHRYVLKIFFHGFLILFAFLGSYYLRFEFEIPSRYFPRHPRGDPDLVPGEGGRIPVLRSVPRVVAVRDDPWTCCRSRGDAPLDRFLFWASSYFIYTRAAIPAVGLCHRLAAHAPVRSRFAVPDPVRPGNAGAARQRGEPPRPGRGRGGRRGR